MSGAPRTTGSRPSPSPPPSAPEPSAPEPRAPAAGLLGRLPGILKDPVVLAALVAVLLFAVGQLVAPGFASYSAVMGTLRVAAFLGIIAAGQTIVILAGGEGIDLSVGKVATFAAIIVAQVAGGTDEGLVTAVVLALAACGLVGVVNGLGVAYLRIPPLVMTLGMIGVVEGMIRLYSRGQPEGRAAPALAQLVNTRTILEIRGSVWIWIAVALLVTWLLRRSTFGRRVYALGANRETAYLSAINVRANLVLVYMTSSLFAALGGILLLGYSGTVSISLADGYMLTSIAAVVIGGTTLAGGVGGYVGTMIGAVVLTTMTRLLSVLRIEPALRQVVYGLILLAMLSLYGRQRRLRQ